MTGIRKGGTSCFTCQNRDRTEWCVLKPDEIKLLDEGRVTREYQPGEIVFHEGDPARGIFCVESGSVGIRKSDADGHSVLLYLSNAGDTLGYRAFLAGENYNASAEVLERSRICQIDATTVRTILQHNPELGLRYLTLISRNLGKAENRILQNTTLSVRARFAHLLAVLLERYAERSGGGPIEFDLPLSRQDMASMIGTTPESLSRTIAKLETDKIVRLSGRRLTVPDVEMLVREFEPDAMI